MTPRKTGHDPLILGNDTPFFQGHGDSRYAHFLRFWQLGFAFWRFGPRRLGTGPYGRKPGECGRIAAAVGIAGASGFGVDHSRGLI